MELDILSNILQNQHTGLIYGLPTSLVVILGMWGLFKMVDFSTGFLKIWKRAEDFSSDKMRSGVIRFVTEILAMIVVLAIDWVFGLGWTLAHGVGLLFAIKEVGSIFENFTVLGVDIRENVESAIKKKSKK